MLTGIRRVNVLRIIVTLTLLFVMAQISLAIADSYVKGFGYIVQLINEDKLAFSRFLLVPALHLLLSQLIIYFAYIYVVWYVVISIAELFSFQTRRLYFLCLFVWCNSVVTILALNVSYSSHSFFTILIRKSLLSNAMTDEQLYYLTVVVVLIDIFAVLLALVNTIICVCKKQHIIRCSVLLVVVSVPLILSSKPTFYSQHKNVIASTAQRPNIFIIGFDALRPDYLSFFNKQRPQTPHFDQFLQSSTVFTEAYVPLARTMPSWVSILTSRYPLHDNIRENSTDIRIGKINATLQSELKKAGYETIYASDDRKFMEIDQRMGFDTVAGLDGRVADFLIGTMNDFPLSNLIAPMLIGEYLFPYNHASHGSPHTYNPNNFLELMDGVLQQHSNKPMFLAVHFNLTGWPFYWFDDKLAYGAKSVSAYANAVVGADKILEKFLATLEKNGLLKNAIVVLLSDHGITLGLPGDRDVTEKLYQGNKADMKVRRTKYTDVTINQSDFQQKYMDDHLVLDLKSLALFDLNSYGIDTSFGYGGDILSLKQHHSLLAFRAYGVDMGAPHSVMGRSLLLDVAPTLLDLLGLAMLPKSDGVSLKPYLSDSHARVISQRPIYLESGYSITEIEQQDIIVAQVVAKSFSYYDIDKGTGEVRLSQSMIPSLNENKQRGILLGDWLLAYYPLSKRYSFTVSHDNSKALNITPHEISPFFVLVNLKTGAWTTEINNPLILNSPMTSLHQQLFKFYGKEMDVYSRHVS